MDISLYDVQCASQYYQDNSIKKQYLEGVANSMKKDGVQRLTEDSFITKYGVYSMQLLLNKDSELNK